MLPPNSMGDVPIRWGTWRCDRCFDKKAIPRLTRRPRREATADTRSLRMHRTPEEIDGLLAAVNAAEDQAIAQYRAFRAAWAPGWGTGPPRTPRAPGQAQP
jgi:hypothetical protein